MTHELKIQRQWADAKLAGEKPFEIRRNDRGFQKGDIVNYRVVDPKTGEPYCPPDDGTAFDDGAKVHPLERCSFVVTYVREGADGLEKGYCVFADQPIPKVRAEAKTETPKTETPKASAETADMCRYGYTRGELALTGRCTKLETASNNCVCDGKTCPFEQW